MTPYAHQTAPTQCHVGSTSTRSIRHASFEFLPCALNHFSMDSWAMKRTLDRSPGSGRGIRSFGCGCNPLHAKQFMVVGSPPVSSTRNFACWTSIAVRSILRVIVHGRAGRI